MLIPKIHCIYVPDSPRLDWAKNQLKGLDVEYIRGMLPDEIDDIGTIKGKGSACSYYSKLNLFKKIVDTQEYYWICEDDLYLSSKCLPLIRSFKPPNEPFMFRLCAFNNHIRPEFPLKPVYSDGIRITKSLSLVSFICNNSALKLMIEHLSTPTAKTIDLQLKSLDILNLVAYPNVVSQSKENKSMRGVNDLSVFNYKSYNKDIIIPPQSLSKVIDNYAGGQMLVFGLGNDSNLWYEVTKGNVLFVENIDEWIEKSDIPRENILKYDYKTRVDQGLYGSIPEIPKELNKEWDTIIIDGPHGYHASKPGRLIPYAWSSQLKYRYVYLDDCNRPFESQLCSKYFGVNPTSKFMEICGWKRH